MGLLDDPNTMANLTLAAGLLGGGNFGQAMQRGLMGYQGTLDSAADRKAKQAYQQSQIEENNTQNLIRKAALERQARQDSYFFGGGGGGASDAPAPTSSAQPAMGGAPGPAPMQSSPPALGKFDEWSKQFGIPKDALVADYLNNGGKGIASMLEKRGTPDMQVSNGYAYDKNKLGAGYLPSISTSQDGKTSMVQIGPDGLPVVSAPRGAMDTYNGYLGATEAAKARADLTQVYDPTTGGMVYRSRAQVLDGSAPQQQAGPNIQNQGQGQLSPALQALIAQDAKNNGIQNPTANFVGAGKSGRYELTNPRQQAAPAVASPFPAAQPSSAVLADKASGNLNDSWIKNSYEPVLAAQKSAEDMITNVKVARDAIGKMGGTGWGSDTKAQAANVLEGLGLASNSAKLYATNAQVFQNTAMGRLATVLNAATGPQTEGDAQRASKQFATLGNTTEANKFILDMAEAKAQRDQAKARFYQAAQPIARQKGDLTEVDREWQKRAPSIFDMPAMSGWSGK